MATTNNPGADTNTSGHTGAKARPERRVIRPSELGQIEMCLESVVIPGELESWASALCEACAAEGPLLKRELESHRRQLAKVTAADANFAQRALQLQQEDAAILQAFDEFERKAGRLHERACLAGSHEDKFEEGLKDIIDDGLALVIRVRKQERALTTWCSESMQRENGVGD
jgi:hypothetical protein